MNVVEYQNLLWTSGAFIVRDKPFTLKSGRRSHVYANHRDLVCVPEHLRMLADLLAATARREFGNGFALATVHSSVSPFLVAAAAARSELPFYNFRNIIQERGLKRQFFRYDAVSSVPFEPGRPAVIVDDVVTSVATLADAARGLDIENVEVLGAVCLVDRRAVPEVRVSALQVRSVTTLSRVLRYGLESVDLSEDDRRLVEAELLALEV